MATINSLLLLLSILALYNAENSPVTIEMNSLQNHPSFSKHDVASKWKLKKMMESKEGCGPDEKMSCYSHCQKNCTNYDEYISCPTNCVKGCVCKEPKIRGPDGSCIMPEDCPSSDHLTQVNLHPVYSEYEHSNSLHETLDQLPSCSGENEIWTLRTPECPDDCHNYRNFRRACRRLSRANPKCNCKPGFVRGPDGNCVRPEQCPVPEPYKIVQDGIVRSLDDCPENEEYIHCGTPCPKTCNDYDKDIICISSCSSGCFCKDPMVLGPNGTCIRTEECPRELLSRTGPNCPEGEYYTDCTSECSELDDPSLCECEPGCHCMKDRKRGWNGKCLPKSSYELSPLAQTLLAPVLCPNEDKIYLFCGSACPKSCSNFHKNKRCLIDMMCSPGCFCKEPKILGPDGKCILPEECPESDDSQENSQRRRALKPTQRRGYFPHLKCGENEEFSIYSNVCPDNCINYGTDRLCKHIYIPGCKCKSGYVLGHEGTCIKVEECTAPKPDECKEREYYDDCASPCERDCYNFVKFNGTCEVEGCRKGCFCRPGFVRSPDWTCVHPEVCHDEKQRAIQF